MTDDKTAMNNMLRILKEEYGIKNEAELDRAIRNQPVIDLAPFCSQLLSKKEMAR